MGEKTVRFPIAEPSAIGCLLAFPCTVTIPNTLIGATGEHLVAAHLSIRGYSVGLTRGGSRSVDVLTSCPDGRRSLAIQVKTSTEAWKEMPLKGNSHWAFMLSTADLRSSDSELLYIFVTLDGFPHAIPRYFMMPASLVRSRLETRYQHKKSKSDIRMLVIYRHEVGEFESRWDWVEARLSDGLKLRKKRS